MKVPRKGAEADIAIIGMACLFPGAPNLEAFWKNIIRKVDATSDPPPEAWDVNVFYDPSSSANDRVYCKRGGFIEPLASFDPIDNGVMPRAVSGGEPDQWLALRVAREAFADAGYGEEVPESERRATAVILGKGTYLNRGNLSVVQHGRMVDQTMEIVERLHPELNAQELADLRQDLKRRFPPFSADTAPGLIPNIIAGRIANRLDLMGPNYTVDAACASSLVAVEHAVRGLRSGEFDLALAGGVHVGTPVPTLMLFCQLGALSRREQIRPFDALADGTILSAGLGMVVLKRRADAERDGNRIYAMVKSVGISSDGRGLGVMAPRQEGEELALRRAYEGAGIDPSTVGLIEAHGTGTPVGDATEVKALSVIFGARKDSLPWCGLGSVKSMIGHAMPAAGIAGIIKTALALYHRVLPPTLHVEQPNPKLGLETSAFYLNTETRPWIHGDGANPRRAGVNAFGFGGVNAHAILEEAGPALDDFTPWDTEVVILRGETRADLLESARALEARLQSAEELDLSDLARSMNLSLPEGGARLAIIASDFPDLRGKLRDAASRLGDRSRTRIQEVRGIYFTEEPLARTGSLAFLFPGEGSQYLGMLSDLAIHFPEVRRHFDFVDGMFRGHARNFVPSDFIFPRPVFSKEEKRAAEERLWQMEGAFEAVLTADWAIYELLLRLGIAPHSMLGHSTGEYAAMRAAGMLNLNGDSSVAHFAQKLNEFYRERGASDAVGRSGLVAVGADSGSVASLLGAGFRLAIAMDNCPHQTVLVGEDAEIDRFLVEAQKRGWICERLSFDRPYHTPSFGAYAEGLKDFLAEWVVRPPQATLYSATSASPFPGELEASRELAWKHWVSPVEFRKTIERMYADGARVFVEAGPGGNLSGFVADTLRGKPTLAVPADVPSRRGTTQLNHLVGLLAVHGVSMKLEDLYRRRRSRAEESKDKKRRTPMKLEVGWIPLELSEEMAARIRARTAPKPATVDPAPAAAPPSSGESGDAVMASYWQTMDRFLSVQQEVMESFLKGGASPRVEKPAPPEQPLVAEEPRAPAPALTPKVADAPLPASSGVKDLLLGIVSERTGYPVEMIGLDLDLEADLGIDSIKRVEILGSLQQQTELLSAGDMESLATRKTLGDVLRFLEGRSNRSGARDALPSPERRLPFLRRMETLVPGKELVAGAILDLEEDLFLRDHALGRGVSVSDPTLSGLPVVPFTMSMEILAEAALALFPEASLRIVGLREVRAHRWMMLDEDELPLRLVARRDEGGPGLAAEVKVFDARAASRREGVPFVEGRVLLAERYPDAPAASELTLSRERPSSSRSERPYEEVMFHGPRFQGVRAMERFGDDGATALLTTLPRTDLFASTDAPALATDPVLLDQPGQVVGFWMAERFERGYVVFPFQLDELTLYGAPEELPRDLECRARIRLLGEELVDSDLDVVARAEGRVVARFAGWKDRRFDVPRSFLRFLHDPRAHSLTSERPEAVGGNGHQPTNRIPQDAFPKNFFTAHGAVWRKALAHLILGPREREEWRGLRLLAGDRERWLFERLLAKDAARAYVSGRHGVQIAPADVDLVPGGEGRLIAKGPFPGTLTLSVTKAGDDVTAAVEDAGDPLVAAAAPGHGSGEGDR